MCFFCKLSYKISNLTYYLLLWVAREDYALFWFVARNASARFVRKSFACQMPLSGRFYVFGPLLHGIIILRCSPHISSGVGGLNQNQQWQRCFFLFLCFFVAEMSSNFFIFLCLQNCLFFCVFQIVSSISSTNLCQSVNKGCHRLLVKKIGQKFLHWPTIPRWGKHDQALLSFGSKFRWLLLIRLFLWSQVVNEDQKSTAFRIDYILLSVLENFYWFILDAVASPIHSKNERCWRYIPANFWICQICQS